MVFHDNDGTFSLIFDSQGRIDPMEMYGRIHKAVNAGLEKAGIGSELWKDNPVPVASGPERYKAAECFKQPVPLDLVDPAVSGHKILGGALRRFGDHVLYQGSLQLADGRGRNAGVQAGIAEAIGKEWGIDFAEYRPSAEMMLSVNKISLEKYRSREWNRRI